MRRIISRAIFARTTLKPIILSLIIILLSSLSSTAFASTNNATDFTYQGYLTDADGPVTGLCSFQFGLFDAVSSGSQIGTTQTVSNVPVSEGVFSVTLDFGASSFNDQDRFLAITVNCGAGDVPLAPRQPITPAPYAQFALGAPWSGLTGIPAGIADGDDNTTYTAGAGLTLTGTQFFIPNDGVTNGMLDNSAVDTPQLAADAVTSGKIEDGTIALADVAPNTFWNGNGNIGTGAGNFVGTIDNIALELRVFNLRALRITPTGATTAPNLVAGHNANNFTAGSLGVTISGGGAGGFLNTVTDSYGTVGGGRGNRAGNNSGTVGDATDTTVGGGFSNIASAMNSTVGGGSNNTASGANGTVGGGISNSASGTESTVGGGSSNSATDSFATVGGGSSNFADGNSASIGGGANNSVNASFGTIAGGQSNLTDGNSASIGGGSTNSVNNAFGTVGGGNHNTINADYGTIGGGGATTTANGNLVTDDYGTIGGGFNNQAGDNTGAVNDKAYATVAGGNTNTASGYGSAIGGGFTNLASGIYALVMGGNTNTASGDYSAAGGGQNNTADGDHSTIGGGTTNTANGNRSTIAGGQSNTTAGNNSTVGGGTGNAADGLNSTVPGGNSNSATGSHSFAAGRRAKATQAGSFVWADSTDADITAPGADTFSVRANGGIYLGTDSAPTIPGGTFLNTSTGGHLTTGGTWTNSSDRNLKANFAAVDPQEVLALVAALPITSWNYIAEGEDVRHIGPVAQDFHTAFGLGHNDVSIGTVDADGVALTAIQGLNSLLHEEIAAKDAQINALETRFNFMLIAFGLAMAAVVGVVGAMMVVVLRRTALSANAAPISRS